MHPLLPESKQLLQRLESLSGSRVEFVRREDLRVSAMLEIARDGATVHRFHFRPSSQPIDYLLCRQVGVVIRMFQLPESARMDFASAGDDRGEKVISELISASSSLSQSDKETLPAFSKMVAEWALMQVRSIPTGMRVDAWLHATFPNLRELVAHGLGTEQQTNANVLGQRIGNLTVPPIQLAPAMAYALFTDRLLKTNRFSIPFAAAGALPDGKALLGLFDTIEYEPANDRQLIDAWANHLGMAEWYRWIPLKK